MLQSCDMALLIYLLSCFLSANQTVHKHQGHIMLYSTSYINIIYSKRFHKKVGNKV